MIYVVNDTIKSHKEFKALEEAIAYAEQVDARRISVYLSTGIFILMLVNKGGKWVTAGTRA